MSVQNALQGLGMLQGSFETKTKNRLAVDEAAKERALKEELAAREEAGATQRAKIGVGPAYAKLNFEKQTRQEGIDAIKKRMAGIEGTAEANTATGQLLLGGLEGGQTSPEQAANVFSNMKPEQVMLQLSSLIASKPEGERAPLMAIQKDMMEQYDSLKRAEATYKQLENYGSQKGQYVDDVVNVSAPINAIKNIFSESVRPPNETLAKQISIIGDSLDIEKPLAPQFLKLDKKFGEDGFSSDTFRLGMIDYLTDFVQQTYPNLQTAPASARRIAGSIMAQLETGGEDSFSERDKNGDKIDNKYKDIPIRINLNEVAAAVEKPAKTSVFSKPKNSKSAASYYLTPVTEAAKK